MEPVAKKLKADSSKVNIKIGKFDIEASFVPDCSRCGCEVIILGPGIRACAKCNTIQEVPNNLSDPREIDHALKTAKELGQKICGRILDDGTTCMSTETSKTEIEITCRNCGHVISPVYNLEVDPFERHGHAWLVPKGRSIGMESVDIKIADKPASELAACKSKVTMLVKTRNGFIESHPNLVGRFGGIPESVATEVAATWCTFHNLQKGDKTRNVKLEDACEQLLYVALLRNGIGLSLTEFVLYTMVSRTEFVATEVNTQNKMFFDDQEYKANLQKFLRGLEVFTPENRDIIRYSTDNFYNLIRDHFRRSVTRFALPEMISECTRIGEEILTEWKRLYPNYFIAPGINDFHQKLFQAVDGVDKKGKPDTKLKPNCLFVRQFVFPSCVLLYWVSVLAGGHAFREEWVGESDDTARRCDMVMSKIVNNTIKPLNCKMYNEHGCLLSNYSELASFLRELYFGYEKKRSPSKSDAQVSREAANYFTSASKHVRKQMTRLGFGISAPAPKQHKRVTKASTAVCVSARKGCPS